MALAMIPSHTFSLDAMMSISHHIRSHFMPVPVITVPVVAVVPVPPMFVEVMVVDMVVMRRKEERIFWGYTDDDSWYNCYRDRYPGGIIHSGSKPVAIVVTIPEAPEEVDAEHPWHHVNVSFPAGNYDNFRWCGKLQRGWRWNFDLCFGYRIFLSRFRGRGWFLDWRRGWRRRQRWWRNGNLNVHICGGTNMRRIKNKS
jgi:hypothetical protein